MSVTSSSGPSSQPRTLRAIRARLTALGPLALLVALAFIIRVAWIDFADFRPLVFDDTGTYDLLARNIAHGFSYDDIDGSAQVFWPPGYPFFLAAVYRVTGDSLRAALLINAAIGALSVALVYAIGRRAFDNSVAYAAAAIVALSPSLVLFAGVTLTEVFFTFLLLTAIWFLIEAAASASPWLFAAACVVIGGAALVRGAALLLPLAAIPFWWLSSGGWRPALIRAAVAGALVLVTVAPWTIRNYARTESFVLISANAGIDLYIGHSANADGRLIVTTDFASPIEETQAKTQISRNQTATRHALKYAATHPAGEAELSARKLYWLYRNDSVALDWNEGHGVRPFLSADARDMVRLVMNSWYVAVGILAITAAPEWFSRRQPARVLLVSVAVYWTFVHVAFFGDPRFHAPILPVFALWAAAGLLLIARRFRGHATAVDGRDPPGVIAQT